MSPVLKDLSSGPPKPSESVPERMDGESVSIRKPSHAFQAGNEKSFEWIVMQNGRMENVTYRLILGLKRFHRNELA